MINTSLDINERALVCENILRALPQWFAIEKGIKNYVKMARDINKTFVSVVQEEKIVGFAIYTKINVNTTEIDVMGILPDYQRFGYGSKLIKEIINCCQTKYLVVKTVDEYPNDSDNYAITRNFYFKNGFERLITLPELWGKEDPCLIMIRVLN